MKTKFFSLVVLLAAFAAGAVMTGCKDDPEDDTPITAVTSITGVPNSAEEGVDLTLAATVAPDDATNKTIVWSVKDAGQTGATIAAGTNVLKTTAAGTVIVTATIADGRAKGTPYTQDFTIIVGKSGVDATAVNISKPTLALEVGDKETLTATVEPEDAVQTVAWTIADNSVATINPQTGETEALKVGSTTITATAAAGGMTATAQLTVTEPFDPGAVSGLVDLVNFHQLDPMYHNMGYEIGEQRWSRNITVANASRPNKYVNLYTEENLPIRYAESAAPWNSNYFSNEAITKYADILCPYPWRVPTLEDYLEMDNTLYPNDGGASRVFPPNTRNFYSGLTTTPNWGGSIGGYVNENDEVINYLYTIGIVGYFSHEQNWVSYWMQDAPDGKPQVFRLVNKSDLSSIDLPWDGDGLLLQHKYMLRCVTAAYHPATDVLLDREAFVFTPENTEITVSATVAPDYSSVKLVKWESDNTDIATVSNNGRITYTGAGQAGKATISASVANDAVSTVVVEALPVASINFEQQSITVNRFDILVTSGRSINLADMITVLPEDAYRKDLKWTSSDPARFTVNETTGRLNMPLNIGAEPTEAISATITAETTDGSEKEAYITVTVIPLNPATAVTTTDITLELEETANLKDYITVTPADADDYSIIGITSSNANIVTVNAEGIITARLTVGTATVSGTVRATSAYSPGISNIYNNIPFSLTVTVIPLDIGVQSFRSAQTWTVGDLEWSDVVLASGCKTVSPLTPTSLPTDRSWCVKVPGHGDAFTAIAIRTESENLCPSDWRVPTIEEYQALYAALGGTQVTGRTEGYAGEKSERFPNLELFDDVYGERWGITIDQVADFVNLVDVSADSQYSRRMYYWTSTTNYSNNRGYYMRHQPQTVNTPEFVFILANIITGNHDVTPVWQIRSQLRCVRDK